MGWQPRGAADGALCLFGALFPEGAPMAAAFTSASHKCAMGTTQVTAFSKRVQRLWSTAKMPGTKGMRDNL